MVSDMDDNGIELPNYGELNISTFSTLLDLSKLTNSYKIYWFSGILNIIEKKFPYNDCDFNITFKEIIVQMVVKSWFTILNYKLSLGKLDKLAELVNKIQSKSELKYDCREEDIIDLLNNNTDKSIESSIENFYKYVPYRFVNSFYNVKEKNDNRKNMLIKEKTRNDNYGIYRINDNNSITINEVWYKYFVKNLPIIKDWVDYKLVKFLQRRNPNVPGISGKLYAPLTRQLTGARKFFKYVIEKDIVFDIYSGGKLDIHSFSIDHFIPWSFVLHDCVWNLTPTSKSYNSAKSNKLPSRDLFDNFFEIQYNLYKFLYEDYISLRDDTFNKIKEDYIILTKSEALLNKKGDFKKLLDKTISPLYQLAQNQGFEISES